MQTYILVHCFSKIYWYMSYLLYDKATLASFEMLPKIKYLHPVQLVYSLFGIDLSYLIWIIRFKISIFIIHFFKCRNQFKFVKLFIMLDFMKLGEVYMTEAWVVSHFWSELVVCTVTDLIVHYYRCFFSCFLSLCLGYSSPKRYDCENLNGLLVTKIL
jgi:hypothetical protein